MSIFVEIHKRSKTLFSHGCVAAVTTFLFVCLSLIQVYSNWHKFLMVKKDVSGGGGGKREEVVILSLIFWVCFDKYKEI